MLTKAPNRYQVYYMQPSFFPHGIMGVSILKKLSLLPTRATLTKSHTYLRDMEALSLEDLYVKMQAEQWSSDGSARALIMAKGLTHTSMSVGDVAVDILTGKAWMVDIFNWVELEDG